MGSYENKVTVVTGAGSGIGRGIVERLHEQGAYIVANDLREDRLNELPSTERVVRVCGDTSYGETSQRIVAAACKLKGGVMAPHLVRDAQHRAEAQHEHRDQACDGESRFDGDPAFVLTNEGA